MNNYELHEATQQLLMITLFVGVMVIAGTLTLMVKQARKF